MNSSYCRMNKTEKRVFFNFLPITMLLIFFVSLRVDALSSEISKIRLRRIAGIIREFTDAKEKLTDPFVKEAIMDKVGSELTLEPDEKPNKKAVSEIASDIRKLVSKRFPDKVAAIKAKAEKEAKKKYKLVDKLEFVTVTVIRGGRSNKVSGIFYRFGIGGKSVTIGDHTPIAFIDLADADRAKFDKTFCMQKRKEYVDNKIRKYYNSKRAFLSQRFAEELAKISKANEALGYIYVWNKWRTPKEVTEYLIQQHIRQNPQEATTDDSGETDTSPEVADNSGEAVDGAESGADEPAEVQGSENLKLAKLKQEVEKRQMEIAGAQYGVDADQCFTKGDLLVLIGLTQDEVNLLTGLKSKGDTATLSYQKGAVEKVIFYFTNHILYKIEVDYRIGPPEGMRLLLASIYDDYGESTEMIAAANKERERLARLHAVRHLCKKDKKGKDTHKWGKNGICTKCGVRKADLTPPPVQAEIVQTWPGNIITAKLMADLSQDKSNFTRFVLTKENVQLKKELDEQVEAERIREMEEDKRKRLEDYKSDFK